MIWHSPEFHPSVWLDAWPSVIQTAILAGEGVTLSIIKSLEYLLVLKCDYFNCTDPGNIECSVWTRWTDTVRYILAVRIHFKFLMLTSNLMTLTALTVCLVSACIFPTHQWFLLACAINRSNDRQCFVLQSSAALFSSIICLLTATFYGMFAFYGLSTFLRMSQMAHIEEHTAVTYGFAAVHLLVVTSPLDLNRYNSTFSWPDFFLWLFISHQL